MSSLKKQQCFLTLVILLLTLSCKKHKPLAEPQLPDLPEEKQFAHIYIPVKLEAIGLTLNLKYKENTTLLTEIGSTDGNKTIISYTSKLQLSKLEKYQNDKLYYTAYYEINDRQQVQRANQFKHDPIFNSFTPVGFYTLAYNDQQQVTEVKYYNSSATANFVKSYTRSYHPSQNLASATLLIYPNQTNLLNYSFDSKKGIVSHIAQSTLFALESEHWFLLSALNNILSYSNQTTTIQNTSFDYEYNEAGYPSKMTTTTNKNVQIFKITYKELQP
jgi:hypothetical protein